MRGNLSREPGCETASGGATRLVDGVTLLGVLTEAVLERAAADAELGGGERAVAVVAVEGGEDLLALEVFEGGGRGGAGGRGTLDGCRARGVVREALAGAGQGDFELG